MELSLVGLSHHTAPVEVRERLHYPEKDLPAALHRLREMDEVAEAVLFSTCNRVEVLARLEDGTEPVPLVASFFAETRRVARDAFELRLYHHRQRDAVRHVFRVAAMLRGRVASCDLCGRRCPAPSPASGMDVTLVIVLLMLGVPYRSGGLLGRGSHRGWHPEVGAYGTVNSREGRRSPDDDRGGRRQGVGGDGITEEIHGPVQSRNPTAVAAPPARHSGYGSIPTARAAAASRAS